MSNLPKNINEINKVVIKRGEYKISDILIEPAALVTFKLDADIACTFYSSTLKKVALARNIDANLVSY